MEEKEAQGGVLLLCGLCALCGSVIRSMLMETGQLSNSGSRLIALVRVRGGVAG